MLTLKTCFSFIVKRRLLSKNVYYRGTVIVEERLLSRDSYCRGTFIVKGRFLPRDIYCRGELLSRDGLGDVCYLFT